MVGCNSSSDSSSSVFDSIGAAMDDSLKNRTNTIPSEYNLEHIKPNDFDDGVITIEYETRDKLISDRFLENGLFVDSIVPSPEGGIFIVFIQRSGSSAQEAANSQNFEFSLFGDGEEFQKTTGETNEPVFRSAGSNTYWFSKVQVEVNNSVDSFSKIELRVFDLFNNVTDRFILTVDE